MPVARLITPIIPRTATEQKLVETIEQLNALIMQVQAAPTLQTIGAMIDRRRVIVERWVGVIRDAGPEDEEDFEDARYWVEKLAQTGSATSEEDANPLPDLAAEAIKGSERYVTAWNIAEVSVGAGDARETQGNHELTAGTLVHVWCEQRDAVPPSRVYYFSGRSSRPFTLLAIAVEQTGGSNGNATTAPSYTYTATSLDGEELGTDLSPGWARSVGSFTAATHGTGYFDAEGEFVLYQVDEVEAAVQACTESP